MIGDGISRTITATTIARSTFHGDTAPTAVHGVSAHIGTDGDTAIGAATDISTHGITIHIITDQVGTTEPVGMTLGTTEDTMAGTTLGIMEAITDGITLGRFTCITAGITRTITTMADI